MTKLLFSLLGLGFQLVWAQSSPVDWGPSAVVPENGRPNVLQLPAGDLQSFIQAGRLHAQLYPVSVTGVLPPYQPVKSLIEDHSNNPLKELLEKIIHHFAGVTSFDNLLERLGLHEYPAESDTGVYSVPYPNGKRPDYRMGFATIDRAFDDGHAVGFTFSCAACHSAELFGKTVLGLSNRFPRANDLFVKVKSAVPYYDSWFVKVWSHETPEERELMDQTDRLGLGYLAFASSPFPQSPGTG
jgi:hypothetical protein